MASTEVVRTRIDSDLKADATAILEEMGVTVSQAIRMMLIQVVQTKELPFQVKAPTLNDRARKVMEQQDRDPVVTQHENSAAYFKSLGI
ncbi:type II toxin-antitoxin system RelB/DinJ family antitoxin [Pseudomonas fuscovaginae UPB0736]|uniref:DNA-damage-inducible protein J n=1 Tax=Pseudomonas asplenii TaxID=53407 RepID=A0A1H6LYT1_9PSED|nr:type II toxin-antitoxin system RelB/DinJ family antitoxin [Pseudomonas fuscovaginae]UUQ67779.1 type II toxin-antitoxin system RelB/DinJ family antitoxin [Pseudomonas fuscovaginae UPB0736]SEH94037.1 DNA-damage-inducible protein J [Pseudomonas fuscovaginae]